MLVILTADTRPFGCAQGKLFAGTGSKSGTVFDAGEIFGWLGFAKDK